MVSAFQDFHLLNFFSLFEWYPKYSGEQHTARAFPQCTSTVVRNALHVHFPNAPGQWQATHVHFPQCTSTVASNALHMHFPSALVQWQIKSIARAFPPMHQYSGAQCIAHAFLQYTSTVASNALHMHFPQCTSTAARNTLEKTGACPFCCSVAACWWP